MTTTDILTKVASNEITPAEAARLLAANGNGKGKAPAITYKVSEKTGALSVYGLGRFPVTLYAEQWERLDSDEERQRRQDFIKANASALVRKS